MAGGEKESALSASGFQVPGQILTLVDRCLEAENIRETEELEDYYLLDSQVRSGNPDAIDSSEVEEMTEKYRGSQEIRKLAVKYYAWRKTTGRRKGMPENWRNWSRRRKIILFIQM